jgi:hypothetical protein
MAGVNFLGEADWATGSSGQTTHDFGNVGSTTGANVIAVLITGAWGTTNTITSVTAGGNAMNQQLLTAGQGTGNKNYTALYTYTVAGAGAQDIVINFGGAGVSGPAVAVYLYELLGVASEAPHYISHTELQGAGVSSASIGINYVTNGIALYGCNAFSNTPSASSTWSAATRDAHVSSPGVGEWNSAHASSLVAGSHTETNTFNASTNGNGYNIIAAVWDNGANDFQLPAAFGPFALTGEPATLTRVQANPLSITALFGSFTLTGESATLVRARGYFQVAQGSYTLTGEGVTWKLGLLVGVGSFVLTGRSAILLLNAIARQIIISGAGLFTVTGEPTKFARIFGKLIKPLKVFTAYLADCD